MAHAAALDDLAQAGGEHVVLDLHAQRFAEGVDAREPVLHAWEQLDRMPAGDEVVAVQADALFAALLDHRVHVGEQAVHAVFKAEGIRDAPELAGRVAERGDERIVLHVGRAEGLVKVVEKGDDGLFVHVVSFSPRCGQRKNKRAV